MKKFSLLVALLMFLSLFLSLTSCESYAPNEVLYVYNWGEYIDSSVNEMFEEEYGIKVIYDEYDNNESMYASLKNGAVLTGTDRLKIKESDRGMVMHEELKKLGGGLVFGENSITVPKQNLNKACALDGHNDHRIVMALSLILSKLGGEINGAEAVKKSYPHFFKDIRLLGAEVKTE